MNQNGKCSNWGECWNFKWKHRATAAVAFAPELNDTVPKAPPLPPMWRELPSPELFTKLPLRAWLELAERQELSFSMHQPSLPRQPS